MLAIRPEDDGTFFCAAQNPAGVARANFTVRVVDSLDNSGPGTSGGLQENTDLYNSQEQESVEEQEDDMFKVGDKNQLYKENRTPKINTEPRGLVENLGVWVPNPILVNSWCLLCGCHGTHTNEGP